MAHQYFTAAAKGGNRRALMWLRACLLDEGTIGRVLLVITCVVGGLNLTLRLDSPPPPNPATLRSVSTLDDQQCSASAKVLLTVLTVRTYSTKYQRWYRSARLTAPFVCPY